MTSEPALLVLDASIGVKWIKPEAGRAEALELLAAHREGRVRLVVPAHFMHEVVAVAVARGGADMGEAAWSGLAALDLVVIALDTALATEAFRQCRALGCAFYDALAPALARLLDAQLVSSDVRAHARFDGVRLIAEGVG